MQVNSRVKQAKATFWNRIQKNPALDPSRMDANEIARISGYSDIIIQLQRPEFKEWFMDQDTNKSLLEAGVSGAVETLTRIVCLDVDAITKGELAVKIGDVVRACEVMLKYAGYEPIRHKSIEVVDREVAKMNEADLDQFIENKLKAAKRVK